MRSTGTLGRILRSRHHPGAILLSVLAGMMLLVDCTGANSNPGPAKNIVGGTVTLRMAGDWGRPIDGGQTASGGNGLELESAMYDTLIYLDPSTGKYWPYVAASWTLTPTSVTLKLRNDVTCSDGTKVTPTVVYNSFARYLSPQTRSPWVSVSLGSGPFSIAKDDSADTFTLSSAKPDLNLLYGLSWNGSGIICPKGLDPTADFTKASYGSGAYIFKSAVQGSEYIMTRNPAWNWGPEGMKSTDPGFPDTIDYKVISNETTAANLLVTGGLDVAEISGPDVTRLTSDASIAQKVSTAAAPNILAFNEAPGRPTATELVRKAIATALDPKAWTLAAGEPSAPISTNIQASPGKGYCYTDLSALMPKPSVSNARQILEQAGYTAGADGKLQKDGQRLTVQVVGSTSTGSGAEYIEATLEQVGITVNFINTDVNTFRMNFAKTNYDVLVGLFGGNPGVPSNAPLFMTGKLPSQGGNNRLAVNDPQLTSLINAAYGAANETEACKAWKNYNMYVLEHWIAMPWATPVAHFFSRKGEFSYAPYGPPQLAPITVRRTK